MASIIEGNPLPYKAPWAAPAIGRIVHVITDVALLPGIVVGVRSPLDPASALDIALFGPEYRFVQNVPCRADPAVELGWEWPPR